MNINECKTFFQFTIPYLDIPVEFQGNSLSQKIWTCFKSVIILPHELGHAIVGKYYTKYKNTKIRLHDHGGATEHWYNSSQESILNLKKLENLIPQCIQPYLPKAASTQLYENYDDYMNREGAMVAAGPIASALFQTANLVQIAASTKKFSIITGIRTMIHAFGLLNEIDYAISSLTMQNNGKPGTDGDFKKLRNHPKIFAVAGLTLAVCAAVGTYSLSRILEKWRQLYQR